VSKKRVSKSAAQKSKLLRTRGMAMAVKLYKYEGLGMSRSELSKALREMPYEPKNDKDVTSGFASARASGETVVGEYVAGFRVPILTYDDKGDLTPEHYVSMDKADVIVKLDRGTIEVRGSQRIANKVVRDIQEASGATITPLSLDGGAKKLYDSAADIASVMLTGIEKDVGNLKKAQFIGDGIQTEDDILMYTRRYKGSISRFRGTFPYPSGAFLTTSVNTENGSLLIYKTGDGIREADLDWIVSLMEDSAVG
jgi:hypothetical protein